MVTMKRSPAKLTLEYRYYDQYCPLLIIIERHTIILILNIFRFLI